MTLTLQDILTARGLMAILAVYMALMFSTASVVYITSGEDETPFDHYSGMLMKLIVNLKRKQYSNDFLTEEQEKIKASNGDDLLCPKEILCADVVLLDECEGSGCLIQPDPQCEVNQTMIPGFRQPCELFKFDEPCPTDQCSDQICPLQSTVIPLKAFETRLKSVGGYIDVPKELALFQPQSTDLLTALLMLINKSLHELVRVTFVHNCPRLNQQMIDGNFVGAKSRKICTYCRDTYDYIRCVVENPGLPTPIGESPSLPINIPNLKDIQRTFHRVMYEKNHDPTELNDIFNLIKRSIAAFAIRRSDGKECTVCNDFKTINYTECASYTMFEQFVI